MASPLCPHCGHALTDALVAAVDDAPQRCPRCDATLTAPLLPPGSRQAAEPPATVPDADLDVLEGWDVGADASEVAAWRRDERPFPTDTVVVLAAGAAGCVIGAGAWSRHRVAGAALGGLAGLLTGAIGRRIWQLED